MPPSQQNAYIPQSGITRYNSGLSQQKPYKPSTYGNYSSSSNSGSGNAKSFGNFG
ncbi:MAG: hypothetical protein OEY79_04975 [Anaplasmataceae bacterium]|nr:hypothetical protein [Anaplasmataceae bacterium]